MPQVGNGLRESDADIIKKMDFPVGTKTHGQLVQIDRANEPLVVVGKTFTTGPIAIPGIGTGAAYADLDAFGTKGSFLAPVSGVIQSSQFFDLDDEGLMMDVLLFSQDITTGTDNSALVITDSDLLKCIGSISYSNFKDCNTGQIATHSGLGIAYVAPEGRIFFQFQARGAVNIAAGSLPMFSLTILSD